MSSAGVIAVAELSDSPLEDVIADYIKEHGEPSLRMALAAGHLFPASMGKRTGRALRHSADHMEDGTAHSLLIQLTPSAKEQAKRVQISLITGSAEFVVRPIAER